MSLRTGNADQSGFRLDRLRDLIAARLRFPVALAPDYRFLLLHLVAFL